MSVEKWGGLLLKNLASKEDRWIKVEKTHRRGANFHFVMDFKTKGVVKKSIARFISISDPRIFYESTPGLIYKEFFPVGENKTLCHIAYFGWKTEVMTSTHGILWHESLRSRH